MKKIKKNTLIDSLNFLLEKADGKAISVRTVVKVLAGRGQAFLLIVFSAPFCQPLQIPGFSTPFGLMLSFIGFRIAFGRRLWLPERILDRTISYRFLERVVKASIKILQKLRWLFASRWPYLVKSPFAHIIHGITIVLLGLILALPLPIPLTNLLSAYPLLLFGLGLLEDDGVAIIIAYVLSIICFLTLIGVFWAGTEILVNGFSYL